MVQSLNLQCAFQVLIHLGTPPSGSFDWEFTDKDNKYHCVRDLTPQRFLSEIVKVDVTSKVSLINDPRNPYFAKYTVHKLNNMYVKRSDLFFLRCIICTLKPFCAWKGWRTTSDLHKFTNRRTASLCGKDTRCWRASMVWL